MRRGTFEKFSRTHISQASRTSKLQYYFRLKAGNGEIIAQSEAYETAQARDKGMAAVRRLALFAKVRSGE